MPDGRMSLPTEAIAMVEERDLEAGPSSSVGVLGREELRRLILDPRPLVIDWLDLDLQLQPNGIDLTLREVGAFVGAGMLADENGGRRLPEIRPIPFGEDGFVELAPGPYQVILNEVVDLPNDLMALGRPRSSLCRCGATLHTAVWDAGYRGRSTSLLVVANPAGFRIQRNARLLQLVFFRLAEAVGEGYRGAYQGENLAAVER
jgi:dUTP pyrophosphatase